MRQRLYTFAGQEFVQLSLEAEPSRPLERQSQFLFERAREALATLGLSLEHNVVRSRVFGRTREARDVVSRVRGEVFTGSARAATSSYIAPGHSRPRPRLHSTCSRWRRPPAAARGAWRSMRRCSPSSGT